MTLSIIFIVKSIGNWNRDFVQWYCYCSTLWQFLEKRVIRKLNGKMNYVYIKLSIEKQDFEIIISKVDMEKVNGGNSSLNNIFRQNLNDIKRLKLKS